MSSQVSATGLSSIVTSLTGHALEDSDVRKHHSNSSLFQFHSKFWGTSMAKETVSNRESNGDRMDVDDEIDPGAYMLDIGIQGLPFQKIWIRTEYIRLFDYVQQCHDHDRTQDLSPSVVITGQPGIGKSVWVYYAIRRCLAERKPVIWYRNEACHLFLEDGVYELPPIYELKGITWTFVDSDESEHGVPDFLACAGTHHFNIFSTSPMNERWSRLHKTTRVDVIVMSPWTVEELLQVATPLFPDRKFTDDNIKEIFHQFSPTPRVCLDFQNHPKKLEIYKRRVTEAFDEVNVYNIMKLFRNAVNLDMDSISDKICLVSRAKEDDMGSLPVVSVISPAVHSKLAMKFRQLQEDEMIRLYHLFASESVSHSSCLMGVIHEAYAQRRHQENVSNKAISNGTPISFSMGMSSGSVSEVV